jgi:hypothetical protein
MSIPESKLGIMSGRLTLTMQNEMQFFPIDNWEVEFKLTKDLNIYNVEWVIDWPSIHDNPFMRPDYLEDIKNVRDKNNIKIVGVMAHFFVQKNIFNKILNKDDEIGTILENMFRNGKELGIDYVEVPLMGESALDNKILNSKVLRMLIDKLRVLSHKYSLKVFFETNLSERLTQSLLKELEEGVFFITVDTGNMLVNKIDAINFITSITDRIGNWHIKDCDSAGRSVPIGEGMVDFKILLNIKDYVYQGLYIFEGVKEDVFYDDNEKDPVDAVKRYKEYVLDM